MKATPGNQACSGLCTPGLKIAVLTFKPCHYYSMLEHNILAHCYFLKLHVIVALFMLDYFLKCDIQMSKKAC